jgi:hypothetical protein
MSIFHELFAPQNSRTAQYCQIIDQVDEPVQAILGEEALIIDAVA